MKNPRLFTFLRSSAETDKQKALMSLELLAAAEDRLEMLDRHFPGK